MAAKFGGNLRFTGIPELRKALQDASPLAIKALAAGMFEEQSVVISKAQEKTPVDTGTLRGSGTVLAPDIDGTRVTVTAGFGDAASKYAVFVHEKMGVHHNVGQSKFLEAAFLERAQFMPAVLAGRIQRAWERLAK